MKSLIIVAVVVLLSGSSNDVGRYQLVVNGPYESETTLSHAAYCVIDTKTGRVWISSIKAVDLVDTWDPTQRTWTTEHQDFTDSSEPEK